MHEISDDLTGSVNTIPSDYELQVGNPDPLNNVKETCRSTLFWSVVGGSKVQNHQDRSLMGANNVSLLPGGSNHCSLALQANMNESHESPQES